jgi:hypothetical protein
LVLTDEELDTLHTNAHALRNVIRNIEVTALEFPLSPIDGVRSRIRGKEAEAMQAALDALPELKGDLQKMMTVVAEKLERDPSEADRQMEIARQTYDALKIISAALDAARATAKPWEWESMKIELSELSEFEEYARTTLGEVIKLIHAARSKKQKGL